MDPDAGLHELLTLVDKVTQLGDHGESPSAPDVLRMIELVDTLDRWLTAGGFIPARWASATGSSSASEPGP